MKILSLFMILIFLAGVMPMSLAKEVEATFEIYDEISLKNSEDDLITSKAIQLKSENSGKGSISDSEEEKLEDSQKFEEKEEIKIEFKKRGLKEEIKIEASEKFKKAEVEFKLKSENSQELEAKIKMLKNCKEDDSSQCQELKRNAVSYSKQYLINLIDRIIAYLEKLEARIESSEEISTNNARFSIEEIKALKEQLISLKKEVESATTKDQIIEISNKLRILLENKIKVNAKLHLEKLRMFKIGEIIKRSEHLQIKLTNVIEELKEEGKITEKVDELITKFNKLIDDAKTNYYSAVDLFEKAKEARDSNPKEAKKLVLEAHEKLKVAHQDLQEAHSILVELHQLIKDKGGNVETECWGDKPSYKSGQELGFFIWQGTCKETWFIDWSGDLRKLGYEDDEDRAKEIDSDSSLTSDEQIKMKRIKAEMLKQRLGIREKLRIKEGRIEVETETEVEADEITGDIIKDPSVIGFDSSSSGSQASRIKAEIIKSNYCSTEEDCEVVGSKCPFGCHITVNKNEASKIKDLLNNYQNTCEYMCVELKEVQCRKNECIPVTSIIPDDTSDTRKSYHVTGKITTNGKFVDVGPRRFERGDNFKWSDSEITIDAYVSTSSDGLRFRSTGTEVTFDLSIDGKQVKELIFIGENKKNPATIPFTLTGKPATTQICKRDEIYQDGKCQRLAIAEDSQTITNVQVTADGSMMMEMQ